MLGYTEFEDVHCDAESDKAIKVVIGQDEYWIPKSQIHDDSEVYTKNTNGTLIVAEWWAEKSGLT